MNTAADTRTELLAALAEIGRARPAWRLGQTMANLAMTAGRLDAGAVWDLEDSDALAAARSLIEEYSAGQGNAGDTPTSVTPGSIPIASTAS